MIRIVTLFEPERLELWRHFVEHYRSRVDEIHAFVQCASDTDPLDSYHLPGVTALHRWPHRFTVPLWGNSLGSYARTVFNSGFLMPIDVDEFIDEDFRALTREMEQAGALYATGWCVDRFAPEGHLPEIVSGKPITDQFPVMCEVTKLLCGAANTKILLTKWPHWGAIHTLGGTAEENAARLPRLLVFHHYKWDRSVVDRMRKRTLDLTAQGASYAHEPGIVTSHFERHGRIRIEDYNVFQWDD